MVELNEPIEMMFEEVEEVKKKIQGEKNEVCL